MALLNMHLEHAATIWPTKPTPEPSNNPKPKLAGDHRPIYLPTQHKRIIRRLRRLTKDARRHTAPKPDTPVAMRYAQ